MLDHLRLENRRTFAVLEYMATAGGLPMIFPTAEGRYGARDDRERAMACVHAAENALCLAVDTAAEGSRRGSRAFYRAYTTDRGPAAVVLMAHGLAAITARTSKPAGADAQRSARDLLQAAFGWDAEAEKLVAGLADQVDPETTEGLELARIGLVAAAIDAVLGIGSAARMPRLASLLGGDVLAEYSSGLAWQIWANHAVTGWLQASDPARLT